MDHQAARDRAAARVVAMDELYARVKDAETVRVSGAALAA
jgi:hypothetical protein